MNKTLERAADTILEEPVKVEVDNNPQNKIEEILQKWGILPKKKTFYIQNITLRNLVRVSKLLLSIEPGTFDRENILDSNYKAMGKHSETVAKIVAIALHNKRSEPPQRLVSFIMDQFTAKELEGVLGIVIKQMSVTDFMKSIISVRGLNLLEKPQSEGEEKTAPGILSAV
jgi:hypothetical protein